MKITIYHLLMLALMAFVLGFLSGNLVGLYERINDLEKMISKEAKVEEVGYKMFPL